MAQLEDERREDGKDTYLVTNLHVVSDRWVFARSNSNDESSSEDDEVASSEDDEEMPREASNEENEVQVSSSSSASLEEYDIIEVVDVE